VPDGCLRMVPSVETPPSDGPSCGASLDSCRAMEKSSPGLGNQIRRQLMPHWICSIQSCLHDMSWERSYVTVSSVCLTKDVKLNEFGSCHHDLQIFVIKKSCGTGTNKKQKPILKYQCHYSGETAEGE
jgi:hypothetical protein